MIIAKISDITFAVLDFCILPFLSRFMNSIFSNAPLAFAPVSQVRKCGGVFICKAKFTL